MEVAVDEFGRGRSLPGPGLMAPVFARTQLGVRKRVQFRRDAGHHAGGHDVAQPLQPLGRHPEGGFEDQDQAARSELGFQFAEPTKQGSGVELRHLVHHEAGDDEVERAFGPGLRSGGVADAGLGGHGLAEGRLREVLHGREGARRLIDAVKLDVLVAGLTEPMRRGDTARAGP